MDPPAGGDATLDRLCLHQHPLRCDHHGLPRCASGVSAAGGAIPAPPQSVTAGLGPMAPRGPAPGEAWPLPWAFRSSPADSSFAGAGGGVRGGGAGAGPCAVRGDDAGHGADANLDPCARRGQCRGARDGEFRQRPGGAKQPDHGGVVVQQSVTWLPSRHCGARQPHQLWRTSWGRRPTRPGRARCAHHPERDGRPEVVRRDRHA